MSWRIASLLPGRLVVDIGPNAVPRFQVRNQTVADFDCPSQFLCVVAIILRRAKEEATSGRHRLMAGFVVSCHVGVVSIHTIRTEFVEMINRYRIRLAVIFAILHMVHEPLVNVVCLAPIAYSVFFGYAHPIIGVAMHGITITAKPLDAALRILFEPEIHVESHQLASACILSVLSLPMATRALAMFGESLLKAVAWAFRSISRCFFAFSMSSWIAALSAA